MKLSRRSFVAAALAAVAAAWLLPGCRSQGTPAAETVRVGTYNVRSIHPKDEGRLEWVDRKEDLAAFLRSLDCDVVGLQEVMPSQMEFLKKSFPEYEFVGEYRGCAPEKSEAAPVCYRKSRFKVLKAGTFWLSETPDVKGSVGWDAKYPRVCSYLVLENRATGRRFCFANCHTDHKGETAREKGMLLVIDRMKEFGAGAPIVFVGDHNCRETEAPARAVAAVMTNALYATETPPRGTWRTFNGWEWRDQEVSIADALRLPPELRNAESGSPDGKKTAAGEYVREDCGARIDYIYVSPGVRVLDYETRAGARPGERLYHSDHFPSVATVAIPESDR